MALDADDGGGLAAFGAGRGTVTVVPLDSSGARRGADQQLHVPRYDGELALQRVGERFLLIASGRCERGARRCFFGFLLGADGAAVASRARYLRPPGQGVAAPLPLSSRPTDRLWMVGWTNTGHDSHIYANSLFEVDGVPTFGGGERFEAPMSGETTGAGPHLAYGAGDRLHMLYGWDADEHRGRALGGVIVAGFRGAVRDFVFADGAARVLVEAAGGGFFAAPLPAVEPRLRIADGDTLSPPFRDRVLVALSDAGELRLRDSRGRRLGTVVPLGRGADTVTFTGARLLVARRGRGRRPQIIEVHCGERAAAAREEDD